MTTEPIRDGLLGAIREHPDDDTPRLILADWLDENAASAADRARAEFIRVQIERTRVPEADDRQAELEARERRLMIAHGLDWFGKETLSSFTFRRGFPHSYRGDPAALFAGPEDPLAGHPIREIDAGGSYEGRGKAIDEGDQTAGDSPADLARISVLDLRSKTPLKRTLALLALPGLTGLKELRLGRSGEYGDAGVARVLDSPAVQNVETLNLANLGLTDAGLGNFLTRPWPRLRRLQLSGNDLTLAGFRQLFTSDLWTQLGEIDISCNFAEWPNTDELIPALERANAERLNLAGLGGMESPIIGALLRAKTWGPVRKLDLGYCQMGLKEIRDLLAHPSMHGVTELALGHNRLPAKAVDLLAASPALARLTHLHLFDNHRAEAAIGRLGVSRYITRLTHLRCANWGDGLAGFVASPNSAHIRWLNPASPATDELFEALAVSPYMTNLTTLHRNRGRITDRGAAALARSRSLSSLTRIDLSGCKLTGKGVRPLLEAESLGWIHGIGYGLDDDLWALYQRRYRGFCWQSVLAATRE